MQPTTAANVPPSGGEMDLQTMQSMEWLFKKERIYLLAQFWQQRATLAEKEVTTLKEQLSGNNATNNCENKDTSNMDRQGFESEIATKDKEINQLLEEVQRLQGCISKIQESSISQITRLEDQLEQKRQHIARLENKLDTQKDYEELKRQVTILKSDLVNNPQGKDIELLLEKTKIHVQERDKSPLRNSEGVTDLQSTLQPPTLPVTPPTTLPHPFQNVDTFGSLLGEEIVSSWRKTIESHQKSPALPSSDGIVKSTTPFTETNAEKSSTASTPQPLEATGQHSPNDQQALVNGNPKSPHEDNNNHNNHNNNIPLAATFVNNFLRSEDSLKSPYRFEEHRSPFKFAEDLGMAPGSMVGRLGESLIPKGDPMEARLQEMLRYNMDKYASQNLDTLHIARRVRELLSIHNIGQRLFAKYVLGLSQGTVSELLSKPKPWDKLTEKGRDSYRKMHAWACDENSIMLLKSLIPKKGKDGTLPFGRPDSDLTEDRLAHILNEANQFTHIKTESDTHSNEDSKSPHGCSSPFSKDSSMNKRLKKYENDDISQDKVVRIYQEELAKLMGRRMEDMRSPREGFPQGMFLPQFFSNPPMDRSDEIRMALDAYHRELAKLNQNQPSAQVPLGLLALQQQALAQHQQNQQQNHQQSMPGVQGGQHLGQSSNGGVQDLSLPKEKIKMMNGIEDGKEKDDDAMSRHSGSAFSLVRPKIEPGTGASGNSTASSPLGNAILPPMTPTSEDFTSSAAASPLQRMASITNSLISQPPSQPHHSSSQRPLKAVLPPITQQQFDMYNNLNTEDIVKRVKEQLSQYSISQRLFGESVLGLSQGSVSDLLARPKPWHMLTQKGREPFIRMKMFLEDDNAVHKLVASQYKIAPEKLMRTGGYGGSCPTPISKPGLPPNPKMLSEAAGLLTKIQQDSQSLLPSSLQLGPPQGGQPQAPPLGPPGGVQMPQSQLLNHLGLPPHHAMALQQNQEMLKKQQQSMQGGHGIPSHSPMGHQGMRSLHQHISPSVYEMAALTQDLDTQVITTKIKEALLANNIGQKIFGEAVLGLSQGSVSELLSKPKPWHMLSIKGREPFIRMQLWLQDAHNIDRLQALKNERREANKRRRSSGPGHDNSSDTSSNDTSEFYHSNSPGPQGPPNAKKQRVLFSEEQKEALRLAFALDPYPNVATIEFLAQELSLSSRTITNWFHNHRMRLKQQVPHGMPSDLPPRDQNASQQPFDPVQFRLLLNQRLMELSKERMGLSGVPLPYPPYLAANTSLAALISRGLLPTGDLNDLAALNNAVKEQMSGLDLSMTSLKREPTEFEDDDDEVSNVGSEDSNISGSIQDDAKNDVSKEANVSSVNQNQGRSSRRKPAAPMWVNPHWEEEKNSQNQDKNQSNQDEVIINGVCVMQTDDNFAPRRPSTEETIRIEPQAVLDRFEDDRSDTSSVSNDDHHDQRHEDERDGNRLEAEGEERESPGEDNERERDGESGRQEVKTENEDERWDF